MFNRAYALLRKRVVVVLENLLQGLALSSLEEI